MNLVFKYFETGVEGIPNEILQQILCGTHPNINVRTASNGMIILTTGKILKCVKHYYEPLSGPLKLKKISNECFYIQSALNVACSNNMCMVCHAECIRQKEQGNITRKK